MKLGFIDYYLDEWHANNYPAWIREASGGSLAVTTAYGLIDSPKAGGLSNARWCEQMGIRQVADMESLVAQVDGVIVLSPDNAEMHEALCQVPLRSGKPVYVDKTFAPDRETALRIFALANQFNTPCWSASALRFAAEYQGLKGVQALSSWGPGSFETYAVHQAEPLMMLMGGKPEKVLGFGDSARQGLLIAFEDGRHADLSCYGDGDFQMRVKTRDGVQDLKVESDFFQAFIREMVRFFVSGKAPVRQEETLDIMAVLGAGRLALKQPGVWVGV